MMRYSLAPLLAALLTIGAVGIWLYLPRVSSFEQGIYHGDEGTWVAAGDYYFQAAFVRRDLSATTWESERYGPWGTAAPPVGKYLMGLGIALTGEGGGSIRRPSSLIAMTSLTKRTSLPEPYPPPPR